MIDLKHFGGGRKLIKQIINKYKSNNEPWTITNQHNAVKKQKNAHTRMSRLSKKD
jgi:hypothetical protein